MAIDKIAVLLAVIGALKWGGIGLFGFDTVAWLFGGPGGPVVPDAAVPPGPGDRRPPGLTARSGEKDRGEDKGPSAVFAALPERREPGNCTHAGSSESTYRPASAGTGQSFPVRGSPPEFVNVF